MMGSVEESSSEDEFWLLKSQT